MCARRKQKIDKNLIFSDDFYTDLEEENMLYASIVRSPVPKGRITGIEVDSLPEGYFFLNIDDVPAKNIVKTFGDELEIFSGIDISYLGEPLGLIAGPSRKMVRKLCKEIKIVIDEHFIYEEKVLENETENLLAKREIHIGNEIQKTEDLIEIENEWESEINPKSFGETNGALCYVKNSKLYCFAPNLWLKNLRKTLSEVTGFLPEDIYIVQTKILKENTNILWLNCLIACQCAIAAIKLQKPVKLEFTRKEQELYAENTSSVKINHRTKVTKDGKLQSMEIFIHVNGGACNPFASEIADRLAISSIGAYDCPSIHIISKIYKSHSIPSSIDFSIIDSKAFFALENQMNKISSVTGIDPFELRKINISKELKTRTSPFLTDTSTVNQILNAVEQKSFFLRKYSSYKVSNQFNFERNTISPFEPPLRGIAVALAYEGTGFLASKFTTKKLSVELTLTAEKKLFVKALPSSKNIWRIWQNEISGILNIAKENIIQDTDFDLQKEPDNPQTADASITIKTTLIKKAAEALKKVPEEKLPFTVRKTFSPSTKFKWNKEDFSGYPFSSTSFAAMVVELELDRATYRDSIRGIWFIIDAGKILNPKLAEISIKNSIQKQLELLLEDDEIRCENISIQFLNSTKEAKQIGDVVTCLLPASYSSALTQALGKSVSTLPLKTDSIFELSKEKAKDESEKSKE